MFAAVVVGGGAFVATLAELDTRYGEVRADGEPHEVEVPAGQRVTVMTPSTVPHYGWECTVTDSRGADLGAETSYGKLSFGNESSDWESQVTFDAPRADTEQVTVDVACRNPDSRADTVLVSKAPTTADMVSRIAMMILGPLVFGGIAFVWFVVLVILQVVRRSEAA